jgi:hypothetical protein
VWANFYGSVEETSTGFNEGNEAVLKLSLAYLSHCFLKKIGSFANRSITYNEIHIAGASFWVADKYRVNDD